MHTTNICCPVESHLNECSLNFLFPTFKSLHSHEVTSQLNSPLANSDCIRTALFTREEPRDTFLAKEQLKEDEGPLSNFLFTLRMTEIHFVQGVPIKNACEILGFLHPLSPC